MTKLKMCLLFNRMTKDEKIADLGMINHKFKDCNEEQMEELVDFYTELRQLQIKLGENKFRYLFEMAEGIGAEGFMKLFGAISEISYEGKSHE